RFPCLNESGEIFFGEFPGRFVSRALVLEHQTGSRLNLIRPKPSLASETIHHRIAERAGVAAGLPDFRVHDDAGFEADDVFALLGHAAPPKLFHVAFELRPERAVIPETVDAAVNFRR